MSAILITDLLIDISNGDLVCSIFDKSDAFDFDIVNFPALSGNIPTVPAYGTYISQLIRYSRAYHNHYNFSSRHSMLAERLFNQLVSARILIRTLCKFMGRYCTQNLHQSSSIICDSALMAQLYHTLPQLMKCSHRCRVLCTRQGMLTPLDT